MPISSALRFRPAVMRVSLADDGAPPRFASERRREISGRMGPDAQLSALVLLLRLEGSGPGVAAPSSGPEPTFLRRAVLISLRNAAILSDGTLKVGWPCLFVAVRVSVAALIGASRGGEVWRRAARALANMVL